MLTFFIAAALIISIAVFIAWPESSLYAMAFLLPAIGFSFNVSGLSIPLADLAALAALLAFILRTAYTGMFQPGKKISLKWPLFFPFAVFLAICLASSLFSNQISYSLWYVVRWPIFLYFAYIFLPFNLVTDGKILRRTIFFLVLSSLVVLVNGYLSLLGQDWHNSFFRIRPMAWQGIYFFGDNHNLIAEFLNVGAFLILSLRILTKDQRRKRWLSLAFLFSGTAIILTFSRAGWITLLLQSMVFGWYYFRSKNYHATTLILSVIAIVVIMIPIFWRMNVLQQDNASSTENRLLLTEISLQAFKDKPILGFGSGQYINIVNENLRFRAKYGAPIDSHGMLQKTLAENGAFGLAAWLFILAAYLKIALQSLKKYYEKAPWLLPLFLAGAGGLFFQFFNTSYYKGKVWLPIAIFLTAVRLLDAKYESRK